MTGRRGTVPRLPNGKYLELRDTAASKARRITDELKALDQLDQLPSKSKRIDVTLPAEVHTALRVEAATLDISITALVQKILGRALGQQQQQKQSEPPEKRRLPIEIPITLIKALRTDALLKNISTSDYIKQCIIQNLSTSPHIKEYLRKGYR